MKHVAMLGIFVISLFTGAGDGAADRLIGPGTYTTVLSNSADAGTALEIKEHMDAIQGVTDARILPAQNRLTFTVTGDVGVTETQILKAINAGDPKTKLVTPIHRFTSPDNSK